jgi:hypothetical protein
MKRKEKIKLIFCKSRRDTILHPRTLLACEDLTNEKINKNRFFSEQHEC